MNNKENDKFRAARSSVLGRCLPSDAFAQFLAGPGMVALIKIAVQIIADATGFATLLFRPTQSVQGENLFLRRQLALLKERGVQLRRIDAATRISLAILARFFEWRDALYVVEPKTMISWQRAGCPESICHSIADGTVSVFQRRNLVITIDAQNRSEGRVSLKHLFPADGRFHFRDVQCRRHSQREVAHRFADIEPRL